MKKELKPFVNILSMTMLAIVGIGFFGGFIGISLAPYAMLIGLVGLFGIFGLAYVMTEFKFTNMNLFFFLGTLAIVSYLLTSTTVAGAELAFENLKPFGWGVIGGGLLTFFASAGKIAFKGKGR